jgi:hypothetical protein
MKAVTTGFAVVEKKPCGKLAAGPNDSLAVLLPLYSVIDGPFSKKSTRSGRERESERGR